MTVTVEMLVPKAMGMDAAQAKITHVYFGILSDILEVSGHQGAQGKESGSLTLSYL